MAVNGSIWFIVMENGLVGDILTAFLESAGQTLRVFFQNEFLAATIEGRPVATTPDLIMLLDSETGEAVTGELMRYGLRATVLGVGCNAQWRTAEGIALAGPRYFGYEFDYVPVELL